MPEIDWSLLGAPADVFGHFQQGYNTAKAAREEKYQGSVLSAYAQNPTDPSIQNALAATSPEFALSLGNSRVRAHDAQVERQRVGGIISGADGDYAQASRAALNGGDLDLAETLSKLDDGQRKRLGEMYKASAPIAYQALKLPYEQRAAFIQSNAPQLKAAGWDDSHLASFDPSDEALNNFVHSSMTLEQAMSQDKVEWHQVGDRPSFATNSQGVPVGNANPYSSGSGGVVPPLPPGFHIEDGGQTPQASGGFSH